MSLPTFRQAYAFFAPLKGREVVLTVNKRSGNEQVARFLLTCFSTLRKRVVIFDTSTFYGTNILTLATSLTTSFLQDSELYLPNGNLSNSLATVVRPDADVLIIDDMNALYHAVCFEKETRGVHDLLSLMRLLAYSARTNSFTVLSIVYGDDSGRIPERHGVRSLSAMGNLHITVERGAEAIIFKCEEQKIWPTNSFTVAT